MSANQKNRAQKTDAADDFSFFGDTSRFARQKADNEITNRASPFRRELTNRLSWQANYPSFCVHFVISTGFLIKKQECNHARMPSQKKVVHEGSTTRNIDL
jgi:hypothetical protein